MDHFDVIVVGGGAAGFFAAITCAEARRGWRVAILERGKEVLNKVKISGGGRCNVTHRCSSPQMLVRHYPRGSKEMLGPFTRFGQMETLNWFAARGVKIKAEADGRMFPVSDDAATIVNCLVDAAKNAGVEIMTGKRVAGFESTMGGWTVYLTHEKPRYCRRLLVAPGSSNKIWETLSQLGHTIIAPVPSLFTFNIADDRLRGLQGISVANARLALRPAADNANRTNIKKRHLRQLETVGSVLITHWGLSGFGILRLSAWGARTLHSWDYKAKLRVNWVYPESAVDVIEKLKHLKKHRPKKQVTTHLPFDQIPLRLWKNLAQAALKTKDKNWADISNSEMNTIAGQLCNGIFQIEGKSTFKEEFVTAGGVKLKEVDFKKFESKLHPGLYFAGEVLDIDAITGGFNFQAAWTSGWIAGQAMAGEK